MSFLLTEPTVVLAVGGSAGVSDDVQSVVTAGVATDVVRVGTLDEAVETLDARDDVGCVLLLDAGEAPVAEACVRIRGVSEYLPVLVHVADMDERDAGELARWRDCRYLPRTAPAETMREAVDDALSTFERRRDEAAESSMFTSLLADAGITVFGKDTKGRMVRMADVPYVPDPDTYVGATDLEMTEDENLDVAREAYEDDVRVAETGEPMYEKLEHYEYDAGDHWSETTKVPWRDADGEIQGVVGVALDATDRILCERELERQREQIDRFASYVSHDLRTPLQISTGAVDRVRQGDEDALEKIESANERIEQILDDLSALSKGDDVTGLSADALDALDVGVPSTELGPLVERIWRVDWDDAALDLAVSDGTVVASEVEALRPAIENLLKNAVKHGGADVTVRVGTTPTGFFVEDDGPGIPESERDRVLEQGYTTDADGTGTGLSIVRETVEQRDWDLTITESDRGGARFEITDCPVIVPADVQVAESVSLRENADVGPVGKPGTAEYDEQTDRWTVIGNGRDIWNDVNEFHFVFSQVEAPLRIEGRVAALESVGEYSKAGLMVRSSLDEEAVFGHVGLTRDYGPEVIHRDQPGPNTTNVQVSSLADAFRWFRLDYVDGRMTWSVSADGDEWQPLDQRPVAPGTDPFVGLAVCSWSEDSTCEATFADVTVSELALE